MKLIKEAKKKIERLQLAVKAIVVTQFLTFAIVLAILILIIIYL